ncbi:MAG: signal peptidase I [Pseudomonadales bacterium]
MDINFPLVLTWAVFITGALWGLDRLWLLPRRRQAAGRAAAAGATLDAQAQILREPIVVDYARSFFPVLLVVLVVRSFLAEPYQIPSESMVPTLEVGDFVLVNKYAYGLRLPVTGTRIVEIGTPQRGDVMVFVPPHDPRAFIKRVIGVPGDHIRIENDVLFINGERSEYRLEREFELALPGTLRTLPVRAYDETFDGRTHTVYRYPFREPAREWRVPEGSYFMMGDNRGRSEDSRVWGFASEDNIVGKAIAIWIHKDPGFKLPTIARNRWLD